MEAEAAAWAEEEEAGAAVAVVWEEEEAAAVACLEAAEAGEVATTKMETGTVRTKVRTIE